MRASARFTVAYIVAFLARRPRSSSAPNRSPPSVSLRANGVSTTFWDALHATVPELATAIARAGCATQFRSFPGRGGLLRRAYGDGWALVGDAGYFKDPITAHGISDALRDAELLVTSLERTGDGAMYEAIRDEFARPFLDVSSDIASFRWDLTEIVELQRALKVETDRELELLERLDAAAGVAA